MIEIRDYFVFIANNKIINNLNITYQPNTINAIIGPNGCGKTTLLKGLCGLQKNSGLVYLNNTKLDIDKQKQHYISAFLEGGSYYTNMSVQENLNYVCLLNRINKNKINETLALVDFPKTHFKTKAAKLSLGQRQKLGLAMVLILQKTILLLDEPLNGLDMKAVEDFNNVLLRIKEQTGTTILLTSHLISELNNIIDTVSILKDGSLAFHCNGNQINETLFIEDKLMELLNRNNINYNEVKQGLLINNVSRSSLEELLKIEEIDNTKIRQIDNLEEIYKLAIA